MAEPTTNLRVRISAELTDIKSGLASLRKDLATVKTQAATAFPNNNAFVNGIRSARNELRGFVGAYLSLRGAKILSGIADEATQLRGRIREAKGDYEGILALAQRTRTSLAGTADLYTRIERSTRGRIDSQQRLLAITETVNQAIKLSYTGTAQGEAAVLQLGQALASGKLAGDELKSIRENAPRLAQAIADGLGVAFGKLQELGKEGKLTSDAVIKSLESQSAALEKEFERVPITIKDGMTQIRNAFVDYVGDLDEASGASRRFANTLQDVAKDLPRYLDPLLSAIKLLLENLETLIVFLGVRLALGAIGPAIAGFIRLAQIIRSVTTATFSLRVAMLALGGPVGIAIAALAAGLYFLYQKTNEAKRAADEHAKALSNNAAMSRQSAQAAIADAQAKRTQAIETLKAAQAVLEERRARLEDTRSTRARGGDRGDGAAMAAAVNLERADAKVSQSRRQLEDWNKRLDSLVETSIKAQFAQADAATSVAAASVGAGDKADKAKKAVKGLADQSELAQDAIKRQMQLLDELLENNGIRLADYFAKKKALQEADIDSQIAQAQAQAKSASSSDEQSRALTAIIKLQRDRSELAAAVANEQAEAEEQLAKKIGDVQIRLLAASGQTARARTAELEAEFLDMFRQLEAEGDETGKRLVRKLINLEASKAQLDQFQQQSQDALGQLRAFESSLSAQSQAGMLGQQEAERQIDEQRTLALDKLRLLRESMLAYLATLAPGSAQHTAALQGLQQISGDIANVVASQQILKQQVEDLAVSSLTTFFTDLASGTKSFKDSFKDLVSNFVQGLAQMAAKALAMFIVFRVFETYLPGFTQTFGALFGGGKTSGNVKHGGGIAGTGGTIRSGLSPLLFGMAPRYHQGGIAGKGPNEVYAVLEKGEEVLARNDARHRYNSGSGGNRAIVKQPILVLGDRAMADALAGSAGEDMVVTHVMNNLEKINRGGG